MDSLFQLTTVVQPETGATTYTYDTEGKLTSMKYPDVYGADGTVAETARTLSHLYDSLGLASLRDSTYPAPGYRVGAWRNATAQITQMVLYKPDGTSDAETFTYNSLGQLGAARCGSA